ncbi:MAG: heme biosynthesis protein HemY [Alphaproteobacteria bacterium]
MWRLLGFVLVLAGLTLGAVWLADHPGEVSLYWQGYRIATSVTVLAAAAAAVGLVAALLYQLWRSLRRGPRRFIRGRTLRRQRQGYRALTQGLVAVAAGDVREARRLARRADGLLDEPALTHLLSAQAAQLAGDEAGAERCFTAMLDDPETRLLGLRGLIVQATRAGDWEQALDLARRAYAMRPNTSWVATALFELQARAGRWDEAEKTLAAAMRSKLISPDHGPRHRAVVLAERARTARARGRAGDALKFARQAHRLAPGLVPPAALAAELLAKQGNGRAAARIVEESWTRTPHPDLADAYAAIGSGETPIQRVQRLERLGEARPSHEETRVALAKAALAAKLWGEARRHLDAAVEQEPTARVFRLLAELEEKEHGDGAAARRWLVRAANAPPDPAWVCNRCGAAADDWAGRCPACAAFDSLKWRSPVARGRGLEGGEAAAEPALSISHGASPGAPPAPQPRATAVDAPPRRA